MGWPWITILVIALLHLPAAACGGEEIGPDGTGGGPTVATVRGQVLEVEAASLTELASLTVQDDEGRLWSFTAEDFVGFTPAHLREHQAFGQAVSVHYTETEDGVLLVVEVTD